MQIGSTELRKPGKKSTKHSARTVIFQNNLRQKRPLNKMPYQANGFIMSGLYVQP